MRYDTTRQGKRNCAIDKARERERGRDVERDRDGHVNNSMLRPTKMRTERFAGVSCKSVYECPLTKPSQGTSNSVPATASSRPGAEIFTPIDVLICAWCTYSFLS